MSHFLQDAGYPSDHKGFFVWEELRPNICKKQFALAEERRRHRLSLLFNHPMTSEKNTCQSFSVANRGAAAEDAAAG